MRFSLPLVAVVFSLVSANTTMAASLRDLDEAALETERGWFQAAPHEVSVHTDEADGTIIVETSERRLYLIERDGRAIVYGIGVAREGFEWNAVLRVNEPRRVRRRLVGLS